MGRIVDDRITPTKRRKIIRREIIVKNSESNRNTINKQNNKQHLTFSEWSALFLPGHNPI
jgi:hypothetical protein